MRIPTLFTGAVNAGTKGVFAFTTERFEMKRIDKDQIWKMRIVKNDGASEDFISATVPGSVYSDLLKAGKMEDPYWRDNENEALELMKNDFEYRGSSDLYSAASAALFTTTAPSVLLTALTSRTRRTPAFSQASLTLSVI